MRRPLHVDDALGRRPIDLRLDDRAHAGEASRRFENRDRVFEVPGPPTGIRLPNPMNTGGGPADRNASTCGDTDFMLVHGQLQKPAHLVPRRPVCRSIQQGQGSSASKFSRCDAHASRIRSANGGSPTFARNRFTSLSNVLLRASEAIFHSSTLPHSPRRGVPCG